MALNQNMTIAALVILATATFPDRAVADSHLRSVDPIVTIERESLEIKTGINPADLLLVGELHNNGTENQIDLHTFSASPDGVTLGDSFGGLDTGNVFGMGDWCVGPDYAAMPYIDRAGGSFDIGIAGYDYSAATAVTTVISDSVGPQFTTTDCSVLDDGTFMVSAQNFGAGTMDYFRSTDQGLSWNLQASFSLPSGSIISPFDGGIRPTSTALGNNLGTAVQSTSGEVLAAFVDPLTGEPIDSLSLGDHSAAIGNGFLKECDILGYGGNDYVYGLCNLGETVRGAAIHVPDWTPMGEFSLNNVDIGATFDFQAVSVSAGVFGGREQFHNFSNEHVVIPHDDGFGTPFTVPDFPFFEEGGPLDSTASQSMERIFVTGLVRGGSADNVYPAIATIDPSQIDVAQTAGEAPIPLLSPAALALLALMLGLAGVRSWRES